MHRALGRYPHIAGKFADEQLPDLACAPMRFGTFEIDDRLFHLLRQLIGIAHRPVSGRKALRALGP